MFKLFAFCAIVFASTALGRNQKNSQNEMTGCRVSYNHALVHQNGKIHNLSNHFNIFYFRNIRVYEFHYMYDSVANHEFLQNTFKEEYFVFDKDSLYGYRYNPYKDFDTRKFPVDSILTTRALKGAKWDFIASFQPITVDTDKTSGNVHEVYVAPNPKSFLDNDSAHFYYTDHLNDVEYSMSKTLDSLKKKKLYHVRLIFNSKYADQLKMQLPKRETFFKLEQIEVIDSKKIMPYIEQYEKENQLSTN